jgi:Phosphoinositide phospholipase C, Ca2+-dependent
VFPCDRWLVSSRRRSGLRTGLLLATICLLATIRPAAAEPKLDELIVKGSHNSFHLRPWFSLHPRHRYEHDPLPVQLEHHGVRALELDLHQDERGVLEVYHIAWVDGGSRCRLFVDCLQQVKSWSDATPAHEPIWIWIEIKDFAGGERFESLRPVDDAIRAVLGDRLLTPDDVRGGHSSLREALRSRGWPSLAQARGRILFLLKGDEEQHREYTHGFKHLRGRVMFPAATSAQFGMPWAAVAKLNSPSSPDIAGARAAGLLVTTTVCVAELDDSECRRARALALASGAQILFDDYVRPVPERDYYLALDPREVQEAKRVLMGVGEVSASVD